jgi:hypothetical protein
MPPAMQAVPLWKSKDWDNLFLQPVVPKLVLDTSNLDNALREIVATVYDLKIQLDGVASIEQVNTLEKKVGLVIGEVQNAFQQQKSHFESEMQSMKYELSEAASKAEMATQVRNSRFFHSISFPHVY